MRSEFAGVNRRITRQEAEAERIRLEREAELKRRRDALEKLQAEEQRKVSNHRTQHELVDAIPREFTRSLTSGLCMLFQGQACTCFQDVELIDAR